MGRRQETGKDNRGSATDRRARRTWLLSPKAPFGGDGTKVPCVHCGTYVTDVDMHVDRIIPGNLGGTYRRNNIQPSCAIDNILRADNPDWVSPIQMAIAA